MTRGNATISHRKRGTHPLVAAGLVIFATVFITYYAFNGGLPFVQNFTVYAVVDNSVNVRSPDPVRIAGIDIGEVQGTSPDGRFTKIAFSVNSNGQPLHTDANVTIRDRLFLEGGYYLQVFPGSPSAPLLKDGATIPVTNVTGPVQFFKVLSLFDQNIRGDLAQVVDTLNQGFSQQPGQALTASGAAGLKRAIPSLTPVLSQVAVITHALQGTSRGDVGRLLGSGAQVTEELAANTASLTGLVDNLNTTAGALAATDGSLGGSIEGVDRTLRTAPSSLSSIDAALPPVDTLSGALVPSLKQAPPLLGGIVTSARQLGAVVAPVERTQLLTSLKTTFEQLPTVLNKLGQVLPVTKSLTDCLRTHVLPILNSVVPDQNLSTGRPAWQDFVHFLPSIVSAAQSFDGNGYWIRLLLGAAGNSISLGGTGLGRIVGDAPSSSPIQGVRPIWQGNLQPSAFQPGVPCASDKLPSLQSASGPPDTMATHDATPARSLGLSGLRSELAAVIAKAGAR